MTSEIKLALSEICLSLRIYRNLPRMLVDRRTDQHQIAIVGTYRRDNLQKREG